MSRAFINEDNFVQEAPERPVSHHVNYVTPGGLVAIDAALAEAQKTHGVAQTNGDREALARSARDLRYWKSRRSSAVVILPASEIDVVRFGQSVTFVRDDGRSQTFRIVGEDEADPSKGLVSHVSPLARALLGKTKGDLVRARSLIAEIVNIKK